MGFFANVVQNLQERYKESAERKKEEREFLRRLELQAQAEKQRIFKEEYAKNAREVAIVQAKREAAQKTGLQKLRAANRLRNLQSNDTQEDSFLGKLSAYTRNNLAKREQNLKKVAEQRELARQMREQEEMKKRNERATRMRPDMRPFNRRNTW